MTKFDTHMRIDLGMVPTKNWPHEWPGSVGSLGPISESSSASRCVANDVTMNPSLMTSFSLPSINQCQ